MGIEKTDWVMAGIIIIFLCFVVANWVTASEKHHDKPTTIIEVTEVTNITEVTNLTEVIENTFNESCSSSALAGAAGQHQYKVTDKIQWSAAAAYQKGLCDNSAFSLGLAWRVYGRPTTLSISSEGKEDLITIQTGGEF